MVSPQALVAYKVRVMLGHVRSKFENQALGTEAPLGFETMWVIMQNRTKQEASDPKRMKRHQRLVGRPHPFVAYQEEEQDPDVDAVSEAEDADDGEHCEVVCRYWDGLNAVALKADGSVANADVIVHGDSGYAIAKWLKEDKSLQLEIPNADVKDGVIETTAAAARLSVAEAASKSAPTSPS